MLTALVLAGGMGLRLRSAVSNVPKPMAPVNGRPFLEHLLDYWIGQGVSRFVLSVGYLGDVIKQHFRNRYRGATVDYACEIQPLGTGGGVLLGAQLISDSEYFLLLNGDTYFSVDLKQLFCRTISEDADCCFSLFRSDEEGRYMSLELGDNGTIKNLRSGNSLIGGLANGGVYCMRRGVLLEDQFDASKPTSLEDDIFPAALANGKKIIGVETTGLFIDIGIPADYQRAQRLLGSASR
jgi:D-glycero-alpha-D-manno-heptose 1-phosphate guanylyltransferase